MASRVGLEIHRRLDEGQTPEDIAVAVRRALSTVYFHRGGDCSCGNQVGSNRFQCSGGVVIGRWEWVLHGVMCCGGLAPIHRRDERRGVVKG